MQTIVPAPTIKIERRYIVNGEVVDSEIYEGEIDMTPEQQDAYKALVGDGLSEIVQSRTLSIKQYGNGGDVFLSVKFHCDQSVEGVLRTIDLEKALLEDRIWRHHDDFKQQLIQRGLIRA